MSYCVAPRRLQTRDAGFRRDGGSILGPSDRSWRCRHTDDRDHTMSVFGDYRVRLDPSGIEHEPEFPPDGAAEIAVENIVLDVELSPASWRPIVPANAHAFETVHFVDGVRRIDARLLVHKAKQLCHGAFGCTAVGAVHVTAGATRCTEPVIERLVLLGSGAMLPAPVVAGRDQIGRASWRGRV